MLFTWILPVSLLVGAIAQGLVEPSKVLPQGSEARPTAKFVPDPNAPPVITQGSGTR